MLGKHSLRIATIAIICLGLSAIAGFTLLDGVAKDVWVKEFKIRAPAAICNSLVNSTATSQLLKSSNMTYEKCVAVIPKSIEECVTKAESSRSFPTSFNVELGKQWGREIGKCTGYDFYNKFLSGSNSGTSTGTSQPH